MDGAVTDIAVDTTFGLRVSMSSSKGDISAWESNEKKPDSLHNTELIQTDHWNIFENPHGIEVPAEDLLVYKEKQRHVVRSIFSVDDPSITICCCDSLQYLYIRDLERHEVMIVI